MISGILMNSYECIVYLRIAEQDSQKSVFDIYREQGRKLLTKGLGTRILMTQWYSLLYFNMLYYLGKAFDCDLLDEMDEEYYESLPK